MEQEKRTRRRVTVGFPVKVSGITFAGKPYEEMSRTINVSSAGLKFAMQTPVRKNDYVTVTLPLPKEMRPVQSSEYAYTSRGVITRVEDTAGESSKKAIVIKFTK